MNESVPSTDEVQKEFVSFEGLFDTDEDEQETTGIPTSVNEEVEPEEVEVSIEDPKFQKFLEPEPPAPIAIESWNDETTKEMSLSLLKKSREVNPENSDIYGMTEKVIKGMSTEPEDLFAAVGYFHSVQMRAIGDLSLRVGIELRLNTIQEGQVDKYTLETLDKLSQEHPDVYELTREYVQSLIENRPYLKIEQVLQSKKVQIAMRDLEHANNMKAYVDKIATGTRQQTQDPAEAGPPEPVSMTEMPGYGETTPDPQESTKPVTSIL